MASKTVFQDIDPGTVSTLGIIDGVEVGIPFKSKIETALLTESRIKFKNIKDSLKLTTQDNLTNIKKIFVLPGCPMPADRMKSYLKEHKITVTNDYEKADAIVTHAGMFGWYEHYGVEVKSNKLFWEVCNGYYMDEISYDVIKYHKDTGNHCISTESVMKNKHLYNQEYNSMPYNSYIISGLALELARKIRDEGMIVINTKVVEHSSATKQVLTEQLLSDLKAMVNGGLEEREMFYTLLPTIVCDKEVHLVYQLVQEYTNSFSTKNKDFKYWEDQNSLRNRFINNTIDRIVEQEHESGNLNSKAFKYFESICRKEIYISNRAIYNFKVKVKPEYRHYLTN